MHATLRANSALQRANCGGVALSAIVRGPQLARLLGGWQIAPRPAGPRLPEYVVLATAVRGLLLDGRLALGVRLPAERELAAALGDQPYHRHRRLPGRCASSGHLTSRRGAGSWTALPAGHRIGTSRAVAPSDDADADRPGLRRAARAARAGRGRRRGGRPTCPLPAGAGTSRCGLPELREAVAAPLHRARPADPARPDHDHRRRPAGRSTCCCACSSRPGSRVLVETPTYPNMLAALRRRSRRPGQRRTAIDPRAAGTPDLLLVDDPRPRRPRLAYLIPDFHNPTGHLMPDALRERLPRPRTAPAPTWSSTSPLWTCRSTASRCRRRWPRSTATPGCSRSAA